MIRAIIYDFDGTILDSGSTGINRFFEIARLFGLDCDGKESLARSRWGGHASDVIHTCWPEADAEAFLGRWRFMDQMHPAPLVVGARETLAYFHDRGIIQSILTNRNSEGAVQITAHHKIDAFFAITRGHEESVPAKPDPRSADAIFVRFEELGVSNREVIAFVGDGLVDLECAQRLHMRFVGVLTGQTTADAFVQAGLDPAQIVPSIADLPKHLDV